MPFLDAHLFARGTDFILDTFQHGGRGGVQKQKSKTIQMVSSHRPKMLQMGCGLASFLISSSKKKFPAKLNRIQYIWKELIQTGSKSFILSGSSIISDWKVLASILVLIFQQKNLTNNFYNSGKGRNTTPVFQHMIILV